MDKEMMSKINEVLKANDRRELSMDELEAVNGGWDLKSLWESYKNWFCETPKKKQKKNEPGGCELTGGDLWRH